MKYSFSWAAAWLDSQLAVSAADPWLQLRTRTVLFLACVTGLIFSSYALIVAIPYLIAMHEPFFVDGIDPCNASQVVRIPHYNAYWSIPAFLTIPGMALSIVIIVFSVYRRPISDWWPFALFTSLAVTILYKAITEHHCVAISYCLMPVATSSLLAHRNVWFSRAIALVFVAVLSLMTIDEFYPDVVANFYPLTRAEVSSDWPATNRMMLYWMSRALLFCVDYALAYTFFLGALEQTEVCSVQSSANKSMLVALLGDYFAATALDHMEYDDNAVIGRLQIYRSHIPSYVFNIDDISDEAVESEDMRETQGAADAQLPPRVYIPIRGDTGSERSDAGDDVPRTSLAGSELHPSVQQLDTESAVELVELDADNAHRKFPSELEIEIEELTESAIPRPCASTVKSLDLTGITRKASHVSSAVSTHKLSSNGSMASFHSQPGVSPGRGSDSRNVPRLRQGFGTGSSSRVLASAESTGSFHSLGSWSRLKDGSGSLLRGAAPSGGDALLTASRAGLFGAFGVDLVENQSDREVSRKNVGGASASASLNNLRVGGLSLAEVAVVCLRFELVAKFRPDQLAQSHLTLISAILLQSENQARRFGGTLEVDTSPSSSAFLCINIMFNVSSTCARPVLSAFEFMHESLPALRHKYNDSVALYAGAACGREFCGSIGSSHFRSILLQGPTALIARMLAAYAVHCGFNCVVNREFIATVELFRDDAPIFVSVDSLGMIGARGGWSRVETIVLLQSSSGDDENTVTDFDPGDGDTDSSKVRVLKSHASALRPLTQDFQRAMQHPLSLSGVDWLHLSERIRSVLEAVTTVIDPQIISVTSPTTELAPDAMLHCNLPATNTVVTQMQLVNTRLNALLAMFVRRDIPRGDLKNLTEASRLPKAVSALYCEVCCVADYASPA